MSRRLGDIFLFTSYSPTKEIERRGLLIEIKGDYYRMRTPVEGFGTPNYCMCWDVEGKLVCGVKAPGARKFHARRQLDKKQS